MKVADVLKKINDNFEVIILNNGYLIDIRGRDADDDWTSCKLAVGSIEELFDVITQVSTMPVDK